MVYDVVSPMAVLARQIHVIQTAIDRLYNLSSSYRSSLSLFLINTTTQLSNQANHLHKAFNTTTSTSNNPPHQSSWIPSSRPATTSPTRSRAPPTRLPRRPTRTLPRTTTLVSALGKHLFIQPSLDKRQQLANPQPTVSKPPAMPSLTRPRSTSTTLRPRPTSRPPPTKGRQRTATRRTFPFMTTV